MPGGSDNLRNSYNVTAFTAATWPFWMLVDLGLQDTSAAGEHSEAQVGILSSPCKCNIISQYLAKGFVKSNFKPYK